MIIEAVVVKKLPLREHDQLVVLYSKEAGKLSAVAKSSLRAHSKQGLALDEGNLIQCELVSGKAGYVMAGAQAIQAFHQWKSSPIRWAAMQFFLQVIDVIVYDGQSDPRLWVWLTETLARLENANDDDAVAAFRSCQTSLLATLGYGRPDADEMLLVCASRTAIDERFECIAQRHLAALDLFYDIAAQRHPCYH